MIGALQTVMRLWAAITDPLVGSILDNTRTRWGRRRPFVLVGSILLSILFPLLCLPSTSWSMNVIVCYMFTASLVFITCYTIFNIPFEALGVELTDDTNERTRLYAFGS